MNNKITFYTLSLILVFELSAVNANTDEEFLVDYYGDEEFISIATGKSKLITKAPAVASIITAQQISDSGARTIDHVLEAVPGLHVSLSSTRLTPIYSIRGIHTDRNPQVLMLLDGTPITNLYFGDRGALSSMPVNAISRIEIIRGPGSAIYGADAFSGVINIITKKYKEYENSEIGSRIGEFGTKDLWFSKGSLIGNNIKTTFNLQLSTHDSDIDRIVDSDAQTVFDSVFMTNASNAPGHLTTNLDRLDLNLGIEYNNIDFKYWSRHLRDAGGGPGVALALDTEGEGETDDYLLSFAFKNINMSQFWDSQIKFSYYDVSSLSKAVLFPGGTVLPIDTTGNVNLITGVPAVFPDGLIGNAYSFEERISIEFLTNSINLESHDIRTSVGLSYAKLDPEEIKNFGPGVSLGTLTDITGTDFIYIKKHSREIAYLSIQDEISLATDWEFTAGLRYDNYSDFGDTINPRLSLVWDTANNLTTKFLYGRAFRAPSFAELFLINNPVILGNPDLDPEIINTVEISLNYTSLDHDFQFGIYNYKIKDLIQFVASSLSSPAIAQNTGSQTGQGIEIEWNWRATDSVSINSNIAIASATDETTNKPVANYPETQLYINTKFALSEKLFVIPELHYIADQNRAAGDPRDDIDDYTLVNINFKRDDPTSNLIWSFGVNNIFDEKFVSPSPYDPSIPSGSFIPNDFPMSGQQLYLTVNYKFK